MEYFKRKKTLFYLMVTSLLSFGFADCHSSYTVFTYDLKKCPAADYEIPKKVENGKSTLEFNSNVDECTGFKRYHLLTPDQKSNRMVGYNGAIKVQRGETCTLAIAVQFIGASISPSEQDIAPAAENGAEIFVNVLSKEPLDINIQSKKRYFAKGTSEFEKWCTTK